MAINWKKQAMGLTTFDSIETLCVKVARFGNEERQRSQELRSKKS